MPEENIKIFVIDASFMLAFLLPDERIEQVEEVFKQYSQGKVNLIASKILPFEVINSLKYAIPKRINPQSAKLLIEDFLKYKIEFEEIDFQDVLDLSLNKNLSIYDASYLHLAQANNLLLLTLDKKLKNLSQN